jgi:hypothetical protein
MPRSAAKEQRSEQAEESVASVFDADFDQGEVDAEDLSANAHAPGDQPPTATVSVPGGFVANHPQNNFNDARYQTPSDAQKGAEPAVTNSNSDDTLKAQIAILLQDESIREMFRGMLQEEVDNVANQSQYVFNREPTPELTYKAHYRHSIFPSMGYQEYEMDRGEDQFKFYPTGNVIQFKDGHFYAQNDNQIAFLDHKMKSDGGLTKD